MNKSNKIYALLAVAVIVGQLHCGIGTMRDSENNMNVANVNMQDGELVITEENGDVVARVDLAGFEEKDINVRIKGNLLWITAKHHQKKEINNKNVRSKKVRESSFEDMQTLPYKVNAAKMEWKLSKDGMLTVTIPKA